MSTDQSWLRRLNEATDYRQLQSIFAQLAAKATETSHASELIASIDDAVRRIEEERSRDENEMEEFESCYSQFKERQRGILGWFRRHLPFTETRRQEVEHRDAIADQRAEILADNLVIARAQMLKQRLLPPNERLLGETAQRWKERLHDCESIGRIDEYGSTIRALIDEISISTAFIDEIRAEIDAFAAADFVSKEDQQRQREDLVAARDELAEFDSELKTEIDTRDSAIKRGGDLVRDQLLDSDQEFYQLTRQVENLQRMKKLAEGTAAKAEQFSNLLDQIQQLTLQLSSCEKEQERLEAQQQRLRHELESAETQLDRSSRKLEKVSQPFDAAKRAAEKSEAAFSAVKRIYTQHHQTSEGTESADEIKTEYERLEKEHEDALKQLEVARGPYEALESKHQRRKKKAESLRKELESARQAADDNDKKYDSLRSNLQDASDEIPQVLTEFEPNLNEYLNHIDSLPFESKVSMLNHSLQWGAALRDRIPVPFDVSAKATRNDGGADQIQKLTEAIRKDERSIKQLLASSRQECNQRWKQRCDDLLGGELTRLVFD